MNPFQSLNNTEEFLQVFENLCIEFHKNPSKDIEKGLVEFRKVPNVTALCKYILEHTKQITAQFQIVIALRDVLVRDWATTSQQDKDSIRVFLFNIVFATRFESFVEKQILQTLCISIKRGWLENGLQGRTALSDAVFSFVSPILEVAGQIDEESFNRKRVAIQLLQALVDEFSYSRSNGIGLSWEYHHLCFQSFQQLELKKIFILALNLVRYILMNSTLSNLSTTWWNREGVLLNSSIRLAVEVLSWPFDDETEENPTAISFRERTTTTSKPSVEWRDVFINGDALDFFFKLYEPLRNTEISNMLLNGITQFASFSGIIFEDERAKLSFLSKIVSGLLSIMKVPANQVVEINGLAQIIHRMITNYKFATLLLVPDLLQPFLIEFTNFSCKLLDLFKSMRSNETRIELEECFDTVMESWSFMLAEEVMRSEQINAYVRGLSTKIFQHYIETRLSVALIELETEDDDNEPSDDGHYEDHLSSIAFIGRFDAYTGVVTLNNVLETKLKNLEDYLKYPTKTGINILLLSEELHWLVLITGHLVADNGDSETPCVPETINILSKAFEGKGGDPVIALIGNVIKLIQYANQCLSNNMKEAISPLLGKTLTWFLHRWSRTYLMLSTKNISPTIVKNYGSESDGGNGIQALEFIVKTMLLNFEKWEGETEICLESCRCLLSLATRNRSPLYLLGLPSWRELLQAHVSDHPLLSRLPPVGQRTMMQALLAVTDYVGGDGSNAPQQRIQYFYEVFNPVSSGLTQLLQRSDLVKVSQNPQVLFSLTTLLEKLRGITRAILSEENLIYTACSSFFQPLIALLDIYKNVPEIQILIFKFFCNFAEFQSENLNEDQAKALFTAVVELLRKFSSFNAGKIRSKVNVEDEKDIYRDILVFLKLLSILSGHSNVYDEAQEVIFIGLSILLPLITKELLEFPKLCSSYFTLVCLLFEDCPHKVAALPTQLFRNLVTSLHYVCFLNSPTVDAEIARKSLEAVGSLAKFNFTSKQENGVDSLQAHHQDSSPSTLSEMLRFLIQFLLYADFSTELLDPTADALLFLICSEQHNYPMIIQSVIDQESDYNIKQKLMAAFENLMAKNQIRPAIDRKNVDNFRKNTEEFVGRVKSFVLRK